MYNSISKSTQTVLRAIALAASATNYTVTQQNAKARSCLQSAQMQTSAFIKAYNDEMLLQAKLRKNEQYSTAIMQLYAIKKSAK